SRSRQPSVIRGATVTSRSAVGGLTKSMNPPGLTRMGEVRAFFRCGTRNPNSRVAVRPAVGPHGHEMVSYAAGGPSFGAGGRMLGNGVGRTSGGAGGGGRSAGRGRVVTTTGAGS